jgi:DNA-binding transcriptional regulator YdaS (Cro superfamily)
MKTTRDVFLSWSKKEPAELKKVIEAFGNASEFARALGVSRQAIYGWDKIPAERVIDVEAFTRIPREALRPDLFLVAKNRMLAIEFKTFGDPEKKKVIEAFMRRSGGYRDPFKRRSGGFRNPEKKKVIEAFIIEAKKVIEAFGNVSEFARALGVSRQAIYGWDKIPAERVIDVEAFTRIPREALRPDLFLAPRPKGMPRPNNRWLAFRIDARGAQRRRRQAAGGQSP